MIRAIITGATGAVGMALIQELVENQIETHIFCRKDSAKNRRIPEHPLITIRYCDLEELAEVQNDTGKVFDVFYHLAWAGTTGKERENLYMQNLNVKYALDAVGAAKRFGCRVFIGAGSQAEYGNTNLVLKSDTPTFPRSGYGYAKLCAGQMSRDYAVQLGMKHIWVRILSIYGPYDGAKSMIMDTVDKLQKGITPQFTEGCQMWDYLFSRDAAKAFRLIGETDITEKTYVLGSGRAMPLRDFIEEIRDMIAPEKELEFGAIPYGENQVMHLCADISELTRDTGWLPETKFVDGMRTIIQEENKWKK